MRCTKPTLAMVAVGALALTGCSGTADDGLTDMTLMLDVAYVPKHAPFFSAVEQGFFEEEGIDLELMPGSGSANTVTSVDTGRVDAGWADFGVTILNRAEGADVQQVNLIQGRSAYATVTLANNGIDEWSDLKGKTVATESAGAMTAMWPVVREEAGFSEDDVNVVHATGASKVPGLLAGQWDANISLSVTDVPLLLGAGEDPTVLEWADLGIEYYGTGVILPQRTIDEDPDLAQRFNSALQKGFLWACSHPEQTSEDFQTEVQGFDQSTLESAITAQCDLNWNEYSETHGYGMMNDEDVQELIGVADAYLGLSDAAVVSPADVYTNDMIATPIMPDQEIEAP